MRKKAREDVDIALEAWARWARQAFTDLGYPPMSMIGRIVKYGVRGAADSVRIRLVEADELCELVDRAVLRLSEPERQVVVTEFFNWQPQEKSAEACDMATRRYSQLLNSARRSVADYLEGAKSWLPC